MELFRLHGNNFVFLLASPPTKNFFILIKRTIEAVGGDAISSSNRDVGEDSNISSKKRIINNLYFHSMPGKHDNNSYNKNLQPFASKLRKQMTKAEACLWKYVLKGKYLKGYQFRRQRPVLNYIADFMCMELKLVIEVDGITHHWEETILKDKKKQKDLEADGFTVLRFADGDILNNIYSVRSILEEWIEKRESFLSTQKK